MSNNSSATHSANCYNWNQNQQISHRNSHTILLNGVCRSAIIQRDSCWSAMGQTDGRTDRATDRRTDGWTDGDRGRQRETDKQTCYFHSTDSIAMIHLDIWPLYSQRHRQTDSHCQTDREADRETDRETDSHCQTNRQTDRPVTSTAQQWSILTYDHCTINATDNVDRRTVARWQAHGLWTVMGLFTAQTQTTCIYIHTSSPSSSSSSSKSSSSLGLRQTQQKLVKETRAS